MMKPNLIIGNAMYLLDILENIMVTIQSGVNWVSQMKWEGGNRIAR
jgi:hypothetical protein